MQSFRAMVRAGSPWLKAVLLKCFQETSKVGIMGVVLRVLMLLHIMGLAILFVLPSVIVDGYILSSRLERPAKIALAVIAPPGILVATVCIVFSTWSRWCISLIHGIISRISPEPVPQLPSIIN
jgi:hypothetical protein